MSTRPPRELDPREFVRHKLHGEAKPAWARYAELVVGRASVRRLLHYELVTSLFGGVPGALGLALRRLAYPSLFRSVGKGVVFGRRLTIRNAHQITLGSHVMLDDGCLIDGRGSGAEGVVIGDRVILNRGVSIQSKVGPISIGADTDVGAGTIIISQGGTHIGECVALGADCKVGGGLLRTEENGADRPARLTRGPVRIGANCSLGGRVMVVDSVVVGAGSLVGEGAIVRDDVPEGSVAMAHQRLVVLPRAEFGREPEKPRAGSSPPDVRSVSGGVAALAEPVEALVRRALAALNQQLPAERRVGASLDAPLIEPEGPLDSLQLVNLLVETEQEIEESLGRSIDLAGHVEREESGDRAGLQDVGAFVSLVRAALSAA